MVLMHGQRLGGSGVRPVTPGPGALESSAAHASGAWSQQPQLHAL